MQPSRVVYKPAKCCGKTIHSTTCFAYIFVCAIAVQLEEQMLEQMLQRAREAEAAAGGDVADAEPAEDEFEDV